MFPSLALLFRLTLTGRLGGRAQASAARAEPHRPADRGLTLLGRTAVACLIVGIGLLTIADARWAHAIGVAALLCFWITAFLALVPALLPDAETHDEGVARITRSDRR